MNASFGSHVTGPVSTRTAASPRRFIARFGWLQGNAFTLLTLLLLGVTVSSLRAQTANFAGAVSTFDGSISSSQPEAGAFDANGNLYEADAFNGTLWEIPFTNGGYGTPTQLVANGTFNHPLNVAVDPSGNVWVADLYGNPSTNPGQVYEIVNTGGTLATTATPVGSGWTSPAGITSDSAGNIFVTDNTAKTLSEITGGVVSAINSSFSSPFGLTIDPSSARMYIVDASRVVYIDSPYTGAPTATGPAFNVPLNVSIDAYGNLWVAEFDANAVRELTKSSGYINAETWGTPFNGPVQALPDTHGNIIVPNYLGGPVQTIETGAVNLGSAAVLNGTSNVTVSFNFTGANPTTIQAPQVLTLGSAGGEFADSGGGNCTTTNGIANPYSTGSSCTVTVQLNPAVTGVRYGAIRLLDTGGATLATAYLYGFGTGPQMTFDAIGQLPTALAGTFTAPSGVVADAAGNVYVANTDGNDILVEPAGTAIGVGSLVAPKGVAIDGAGNLFVADTGNNRVVEIAGATITPLGGSFSFSSPNAVAIDQNGNVFVADGGSNNAVEEITAASGYSTVQVLKNGFNNPLSVAVDIFGNVFVVDSGATSVTRLQNVNGVIPPSPTSTNIGTFTGASSIAVDGNANLYVLDGAAGTISEFAFTGSAPFYSNTPTSQIVTGLATPVALTVDGHGNVFYTSGGSDNKTYKIDLADAPTLTFLSSPFNTTSTDSPKSVVIANIGQGFGNPFQMTSLAVTTTTSGAANSFAQVAGTGTPTDCSASTSLAPGTSCNLSISFTPQAAVAITGTAILTDNNLNSAGVTQTITLNGTGGKITPTIASLPTASTITYGQTLASSTLSGGSVVNGATTVNGTWTWTTSTTAPGAGTQSEGVTFTPDDTVNYATITGTVSVVVNMATLTISTPPTASAITFGQTLASSTLSGGSVVSGSTSVTGSWTWNTPSTAPNAGTQSEGVTFTPTDTTDYSTVTGTASVVVNKGTLTISTPPTASAITFGQTLASSTLSGGSVVSGSTSVTGSWTWNTPSTAPTAGTQSEGVTFTPTDTTDYSTVTGTASVVVNKATLTISTPPTASAITYGQTLASSTLTGGSVVSGSTSVTGSWTWNTPSTAPNAGTQSEGVTFTPTDTADYNTASANVNVVVSKDSPTITWPTATAISFGQTLASSTLSGGTALNGSTNVPGNFAFTTPTTAPPVGTNAQGVTFTPTDTANYNAVSGSVNVTVNKAAPTVTWPTATALTYGQTLASSTLSGGSAVSGTTAVTGTFAFTTPTTVPTAGTDSENVTFTPTNTTDYSTVSGTVNVVVSKASPTVTWPTASAITYGQTLASSTLAGGSALNGATNVPGTFAFTTPTTAPTAGTHAEGVTFTPTDLTDYNTASGSVNVIVNQANTTITWAAPAAIVYGTPLSATQLNATASVAGSFAYTPAAGTVLPVGAGQTLSVTFTPTDSTDYKPSTATTVITVAASGLTVSANNATRVYGTANPTFTGTVTGAQNGDTFTESFTTAATITSNAGAYPIVPSASGTNLANYTVVINNGTLTITKANTTTGISASGSAVNPGDSVTLTATVASATSGTPTGIVSFYDGATLLGTGTLTGGVATYATTSLAAGVSHTLTAVYGGDVNFNSSTTTTSTGITVGVLDFTLGAPTPATQTGNTGTAFTYSFGITPTFGTYSGTVNFTATGLPSGGAATFSPASIPANGGPQTVTMIVNTAAGSAALVHPATAGRPLIPVALAFFFLPLFGTKRMRREGRRFGRLACMLLLVLAGLGATAALTGCGSHAGGMTNSQSYTITITATSGSIQHTSTVTLDLQQ